MAKGCSYTIVFEFDLDDLQTQSIQNAIFDPLCSLFHVAVFENFRTQSLKDLYAILEDITAKYRPFHLVPGSRPYNGGYSIGVPFFTLKGESEYDRMADDLVSRYPHLRHKNLHATLQCCAYREQYNLNYLLWVWQRGGPFQMRVSGLRVIQNTKRGPADREVFYFRTPQKKKKGRRAGRA